MGCETFTNDLSSSNVIRLPEGLDYGFYKHKSSFMVESLKSLIDYRDELKREIYELKKEEERTGKDYSKRLENMNNEQKVVKFITNSIYGVLGFPSFRLFNRDIARAITKIGRNVTIETADICERNGFKVVYGDTDSVMIKLRNLNKSDAINYLEENYYDHLEDPNIYTNDELALIGESYYASDLINDYYKTYTRKYNLKENYLLIKPEDISKYMFMSKLKGGKRTAQKRYMKKTVIEFVLDKPIKKVRNIIKGYKKSDLSTVATNILEELSNLIMLDKDNVYIRKKIKDLFKDEIGKIKESIKSYIQPNNHKRHYKLKEICMTKGIRKSLVDGYKKPIPQIIGARFTNNNAHYWNGSSNYGKGSTSYYLPIKGNLPYPYPNSEYVSLDDNKNLPKKIVERVDVDDLLKRTIIEPFKMINKAMHIKIEYSSKNRKLSNKNKTY
ncbi:MAG: DNA polymerase domain-containing protein, partial [bacterium]